MFPSRFATRLSPARRVPLPTRDAFSGTNLEPGAFPAGKSLNLNDARGDYDLAVVKSLRTNTPTLCPKAVCVTPGLTVNGCVLIPARLPSYLPGVAQTTLSHYGEYKGPYDLAFSFRLYERYLKTLTGSSYPPDSKCE